MTKFKITAIRPEPLEDVMTFFITTSREKAEEVENQWREKGYLIVRVTETEI